MAIDLATGEFLFAPARHIWFGESPDGRWALLSGGGEQQSRADFYEWANTELLVYSFETGEMVELFSSEGETVYNPLHERSLPTLLWSPG